jgi:hypothetical protein
MWIGRRTAEGSLGILRDVGIVGDDGAVGVLVRRAGTDLALATDMGQTNFPSGSTWFSVRRSASNALSSKRVYMEFECRAQIWDNLWNCGSATTGLDFGPMPKRLHPEA